MPNSPWLKTAQGLDFGDESDDGVASNVEAFAQLLAQHPSAPPLRPAGWSLKRLKSRKSLLVGADGDAKRGVCQCFG